MRIFDKNTNTVNNIVVDRKNLKGLQRSGFYPIKEKTPPQQKRWQSIEEIITPNEEKKEATITYNTLDTHTIAQAKAELIEETKKNYKNNLAEKLDPEHLNLSRIKISYPSFEGTELSAFELAIKNYSTRIDQLKNEKEQEIQNADNLIKLRKITPFPSNDLKNLHENIKTKQNNLTNAINNM